MIILGVYMIENNRHHNAGKKKCQHGYVQDYNALPEIMQKFEEKKDTNGNAQ